VFCVICCGRLPSTRARSARPCVARTQTMPASRVRASSGITCRPSRPSAENSSTMTRHGPGRVAATRTKSSRTHAPIFVASSGYVAASRLNSTGRRARIASSNANPFPRLAAATPSSTTPKRARKPASPSFSTGTSALIWPTRRSASGLLRSRRRPISLVGSRYSSTRCGVRSRPAISSPCRSQSR